MVKKDFLWLSALAIIIILLLLPATHGMYLEVNRTHPYIMGFVKVSILATMGELLAARIAAGKYKCRPGNICRFVVWGFLGMTFVLVFDLFANGVSASMNKGFLPALHTVPWVSALLQAFFTSALMNLIFGPSFMLLHRITDTYIEIGNGKMKRILKVSLEDVIKKIDWQRFISFTLFKTIPFFWIPMHTVMFLLMPEYRVLMAAFLSIALGVILSFAGRKKVKEADYEY
jgi:Mpv17 / PMP22 family.